MLLWESVKDEFVWEGSWRDICVPDASLDTWRAVVDAARDCESRFEAGDGGPKFPTEIAAVFDHASGSRPLWCISAGRVRLHCHFFDLSEIEFDFDPRQVTGQLELDAVLRFMGVVARSSGRCALMTPENMHDAPFIRVAPPGEAEYISSEGFFRQMAEARTSKSDG